MSPHFQEVPVEPGETLARHDGPTDMPLLEGTIDLEFAAVVERFPNRVAVKASNRQLSYAELDVESDSVALGLSALQIRPHDRVAVSLGNNVEYVVIVYACAKLGAVLVPLNPAYSHSQTISALNHVTASCLILSTEISLPYKAPKTTKDLLQEVMSEGRQSNGLPSKVASLRQIVVIDNSCGRIDLTELACTADYDSLVRVNSAQRFSAPTQLHAEDVVNIQFTSGTTSSPKAACLSHRNIINNAFLVGEEMRLTETDVICCPPPLFHCFGIVLGVLAAMTHGSTLLLPSESFNPRAILKAVEDSQATALYGVPTMFLAELELLAHGFVEESAFSKLRTGLIGGSTIAPALRGALHDHMNLSGLLNIYGLTESSPVCCMTRPHDPLHKQHRTVGQALPHTSIRIAARDNAQKTLRVGERGELLIGGYSVMKGYWRDKEKTAEALVVEAGVGEEAARIWLRSGDEALMDSKGYIQITGRIKDIIIRGGENIYPPEIENVLLQHSQVSNASIVGIPDPFYGEVVAAFVMIREGVEVAEPEQELGADLRSCANREGGTGGPVRDMSTCAVLTTEGVRSWIRSQLSKTQVPKYVFWMSELPLTASGKVEKYKLRELGVRWLHAPQGNASTSEGQIMSSSCFNLAPSSPLSMIRNPTSNPV